MASYRSVDPKSWSYLRGISILQQIVCENAQQIEQIYVSPGHIFVSLCKGKLLCTFDATPTQKFLKHNEEEKITEELSLFLKDPTKEIVTNQVVLISHLFSSFSDILISSNEITFAFGLTKSGFVYLWRWDEESYRWILEQKDIELNDIPKPCKNFSYSSSYNCLVWWEVEDLKFRLKTITFSKVEKNKKKDNNSVWQIDEGSSVKKLSIELGTSVDQFFGCKDGFWLITSHSLHFWSYKLNSMHSFELEYDDGTESESLREIFKVNVHRVTQELVILDPSGQVFVASIDSSNGQIRISKTSTLAFLPPNDFSLLLHTHIVICLTREHCWYFHLRTGKLLAEESLPVSIDNPLSKQVYCWKIATLAGSEKAPSKVGWWIPYLGIYEIKMNSPISSQLESAAKNKLLRLPSKESLKQNQTPVDKHLILALCREWKLDYLESKFILDLLFMNNTWTENSSFKLSSSDESVTVGSIAEHYAALIESLLSHLQSPALVLPLLSKNPSSKKFIVEKLEIFLQKYNNETKNKSSHNTNSSSLDVQANSTRLGALLSFQYHTPLNETIVPLLTQYVNSRKQQPLVLSSENPESTNYTPSSFRSILSLSGEEILLLNRSTFEQFCRKEPQLMLEKLENHFQIKTPNPNLGSFVHAEERKFQGPTGGRSQQLMLFEYMCQLYFAVEPEYLPKFIFQVSSAILSSSSPSNSNRPLIDKRYCLRALAVLPPLQKNESSNKLQTRVELLCYCGKFGMATKLLFLLDKWKETFQVLNRVYSQPPGAVGEDVKTELFSLLFSYCIKTRKYQLFQELWEFLPSSLTCLNLIQLLKQPSSTQDGNGKVSVLVRDEKDFPLSFLLPQFLKMIEKRKLENKKKFEKQ